MMDVSQAMGSPLVLVALALFLIVVMYLGRSVAHAGIRALFKTIHDLFRLCSGFMMSAQERLVQRNREVILEMGREETERTIEREFHRVNAVVARDLSGYPALQRKLSDQIARIDEDYRQSTEVPPSPPEWARVVETMATIPTHGDPLMAKILADVQKAMSSAHKSAMREYRTASGERHRLLNKMLPFWRRLENTLDRVDGTIRGIYERSQVIDRKMEAYEQILAKSDNAVRMLSASWMTHFLSSALVLIIAVMGGFINFHLIALPMSEMVGATSYVGPIATSDIAALVTMMTETAMGLFLMESLRITRLFPVISTMDDQLRQRMAWISFGILFVLACVESSLAYMRDLLAADREALTQALAGVHAANVDLRFRWIPSVGQMVMGFMLPFALCFAAIPLESFIRSSRVVFGNLMALTLRGVAAMLDLSANLTKNIGVMLVHGYDFVIAVPLRIEQMLKKETPSPQPTRAHPHEAL
jgi:hypothetical protein